MYYTTFNIYRTCMCRAPARPVRACPVRTCCTAVQEHDLRATTLQCNAKPTLSSHFTVPSSHPALHKPYFISSQATLQQLLAHIHTQPTFTQRSFYTQKPEAFAHRGSLHTEAFTQRRFCTQQPFTHSKFLHTTNFDTEKLLHTEAFFTQKLLHNEAVAYTKLLQI